MVLTGAQDRFSSRRLLDPNRSGPRFSSLAKDFLCPYTPRLHSTPHPPPMLLGTAEVIENVPLLRGQPDFRLWAVELKSTA